MKYCAIAAVLLGLGYWGWQQKALADDIAYERSYFPIFREICENNGYGRARCAETFPIR